MKGNLSNELFVILNCYRNLYPFKEKNLILYSLVNINRLVAEMSMEKKIKSQKGKNKTSEGRKQLSSVRVIQRNLVYIVGLPLNLADEDVGIPSKTSIC